MGVFRKSELLGKKLLEESDLETRSWKLMVALDSSVVFREEEGAD